MDNWACILQHSLLACVAMASMQTAYASCAAWHIQDHADAGHAKGTVVQACSCLTMVVRAVLLLAIAVVSKPAAACVACGWLVGCIALGRSIPAVLIARHGSCVVGCLGHVGCWVLGSSILGHVGILRHPGRHSTRRPILHLHGSDC